MIRLVKRSFGEILVRVAFRIFVYAVLLGLLSIWMLWGAVVYDEAFYDEIGPVETLETVFAAVAALFFLLAARRNRSYAPCGILLTGVLACVFIREFDYFLDMIARFVWKAGVGGVLILMGFYVVKNVQTVYASVLEFINRPSFGIFVSGMLVLIVFSRLFGYGPFWKAIMDNSSYHTVKTIVEEGVEQMGYFLIFISSCEYLNDAQNRYELSSNSSAQSG